MRALEIIFWIDLPIVLYTYIGYGVILYALVKLKECFRKATATPPPVDGSPPDLTLFIAAYNEEDVVDEKMRNCLALDCPADKLHIPWATDGSNDHTNEHPSRWPQVTVLHQPQRQGRTAALNREIRFVTIPLVVFTDANTYLSHEALREIVRAFATPKVGCMAGGKRIATQAKDNTASGDEGLYWKYESALKKLDARLYSTAGTTGELFAVRRELFEEVPADILLSDFIFSLRIVMCRYTIAHCADAYVTKSSSADMHEEEERKARITADGLQSVWRLRTLLDPLRCSTFCFQYISRRVLRWSLTPVLSFSLLPLDIILIFTTDPPLFYAVIWLLQTLFYFMASWGYYLSKKHIKNKVLFAPYYFLFMNINVVHGFSCLRRRRGQTNGTWEKAQRA